MNGQDWQRIQFYALRAVVIITFLAAFFGTISGIYGVARYLTPTTQQNTK